MYNILENKKNVKMVKKHNIYITWSAVDEGVEKLAEEIRHSKLQFDGIYAIPRGGLIIGVMLSHKLDLPLLIYPTEKTLVVDDIGDTGRTLMRLKNRKIACLFSTRWTKVRPDFSIYKKLSKEDWIVFPWEKNL